MPSHDRRAFMAVLAAGLGSLPAISHAQAGAWPARRTAGSGRRGACPKEAALSRGK